MLVYCKQGERVAVGTHKGLVQVWDVSSNKRLSVLDGHSVRVGALAWCGDTVSSGSRDRHILQRDVRMSGAPVRRLLGHKQEVCRLNLCYLIQFMRYIFNALSKKTRCCLTLYLKIYLTDLIIFNFTFEIITFYM